MLYSIAAKKYYSEGHYEMKDGKMKYIQKKETFQYIPILETLKALLNHPDILTEVTFTRGVIKHLPTCGAS
jgi:hypothetical protein